MLNRVIPKIILFWPVIKFICHFLFIVLMIINVWQHNRDHNIIHQLQILVDYAQLEPETQVHAISQD